MSHIIDAEVAGLAGKTKPMEISFDRHVNIIYGPNGSGKTSLLKILHSAMTGDARPLRNVPFTQASVRIHSLSENKAFTRTISKSEMSRPVHVETETPSEIAEVARFQLVQQSLFEESAIEWSESPRRRGEKKRLTRWQHRYLPTTRLHVSEDPLSQLSGVLRGGNLTEELLDEYFAASLGTLWTSYSSEVLQAVRTAQEKGLASILRAVLAEPGSASAKGPREVDLERAYESARRFLDRQKSPSVLGTFEQFSTRYETDKSLQSVIHDIFKVEQEIDVAMTPRRELERLVRKLYSGSKRVSFDDRSIIVEDADGKQIGLASLSSGEKHLIRLLVESLIAEKDSILIDEPEISMHVDWQRELVAIFRTLNPNAQFILATHSPEIMADVSDERIFSL